MYKFFKNLFTGFIISSCRLLEASKGSYSQERSTKIDDKCGVSSYAKLFRLFLPPPISTASLAASNCIATRHVPISPMPNRMNAQTLTHTRSYDFLAQTHLKLSLSLRRKMISIQGYYWDKSCLALSKCYLSSSHYIPGHA